MAEMVNRAALLDKLSKRAYEWRGTNTGDIYANITQMVKRLPYADAEPVVRCKDCKRCDGFPEPNDIQPNEIGICKINMMAVSQNDFCSYGERRNDGKQA